MAVRLQFCFAGMLGCCRQALHVAPQRPFDLLENAHGIDGERNVQGVTPAKAQVRVIRGGGTGLEEGIHQPRRHDVGGLGVLWRT
ncbi:hypothetical protein D3C80_1740500 [compost metagenome]